MSLALGSNQWVRVMSVSELDQQEREEADAKRRQAEENQQRPVITGLAAHLRVLWGEARDAKHSRVQDELLDNQRRTNGEYDPGKLAAIREQGGAEIFMQLTQAKKRAIKAWIKDIMIQASDPPFGLEPTPIPDPPPEVEKIIREALVEQAVMQAQAAGMPGLNQQMLAGIEQQVGEQVESIRQRAAEITKEIAEKMKDKIHDQFVDGEWELAFDTYLEHLTTFKSAFLKGPVIKRKKELKWIEQPDGGYLPKAEESLVREWYAPSPLDIYPAPDSKKIGDSYLFERHRLPMREIGAMRGVKGYDTGAIDMVLSEYGQRGLREWLTGDQERAVLENRGFEQMHSSTMIDALQFWGPVQGKLLVEWGMDRAQIKDLYGHYWIEAWMIGSWVIKAQINPDPLDRIPMFGTSFEKIPGSFWGRAVPEILKDIQDICNACARAVVNNMGFASGPMVGYNKSRMPQGENIEEIFPWKVFYYNGNDAGITDPPMTFFQPSLVSEQLLRVFDYFSKLADEYIGVPSYSHGDNPTGGAGKTASGLSMLMGAAAKVVKNVISNCDMDVIQPCVEFMYTHNMMYDPDKSIKGDLRVIAMGSLHLFVKEQMQMRRNDFLAATNNPADLQIMGLEGRAELLREAARALDLPVDKIIPDNDMISAAVMQHLSDQQQPLQEQGMLPDQQNLQNQQMQQPLSGGQRALPRPRAMAMDGMPYAGQGFAQFTQQKGV